MQGQMREVEIPREAESNMCRMLPFIYDSINGGVCKWVARLHFAKLIVCKWFCNKVEDWIKLTEALTEVKARAHTEADTQQSAFNRNPKVSSGSFKRMLQIKFHTRHTCAPRSITVFCQFHCAKSAQMSKGIMSPKPRQARHFAAWKISLGRACHLNILTYVYLCMCVYIYFLLFLPFHDWQAK